MDFFDVAILILVFGLVFKKLISQKVYVVSLILSALVVVVQILMVGYKWQYVPLYLIIVISAINYKIGFRFNNKIIKSLSLSFLFLLFLSSGLLIYYLPVPKFTVEDKAYSVGYEEIHIVVEGRAQPKAFYELSNLDSLGTRELLVDIYYPSSSETKPVQLFKNASSQWGVTVINYLNRTWGINLPTFLFTHLNLSYFDVGNDLSKLTIS